MSKIKIEIKHWLYGSILFTYESEGNTVQKTLEKAVSSKANLSGADLRSANLSGADLRSANLRSANLRSADLSGADLRSANLSGADLRSANLSGADLRSANLRSANLRSADLSGADLRSANLSGANLRSADLRSANLSGADLRSANLSGADLSGADLRSANLRSANLRSADLSGADLRSANLRSADLTPIKADFFMVLLYGIREVGFLKQALLAGKIDGSTYEGNGECSCLSGTLVTGAVKQNGPQEQVRITSIKSCRESNRPAERFFLGIRPGDTPENNQAAKVVLEWIEEFERLTAK